MREIGSEFWLEHDFKQCENTEIPKWLKLGNDNRLLLSGRTAIHFVLKDIQKNKKVTTVYFPGYSCQSMVQPFLDLGFNIIYYGVFYDNGLKFDIDHNQECDIFFAMNYFGFSEGRMDKYINIFKERKITVIEDVTHSLLSNNQFNVESDYIIASLRKWFPIISGGIASKKKGFFNVIKKDKTFEKMVNIRKSAMIDKRNYINGDKSINKENFLKKYSIANKMLSENYKNYDIDKDSIKIIQNLNLEYVIYKRKKNVQLLLEKLSIKKEFNLLYKDVDDSDCPIFIPIIMNNKSKRDLLHKYLINNSIYCPIHWPIPKVISKHKRINIFDLELSLVIDQRYGEEDMEYLIKRVEEF